jgi:hypothetical protein
MNVELEMSDFATARVAGRGTTRAEALAQMLALGSTTEHAPVQSILSSNEMPREASRAAATLDARFDATMRQGNP